jgi:hypothetical protein
VPEIQVEPEDLGSFGDLWEGMEDYRARLKEYLRQLKPGSGLRFLLDPFTAGDGSTGREDLVFPSSLNFRDAYADWLQKKIGIGALNNSWRMNDRRVPGFEEAARLVPTWSRNDPPEGDGWMIDPVDHVAYRCTPRLSTAWSDLDNFRADFLKRSMNDVATSLKNEVLNVPIVFSWAAYHPLFNNAPSPGGYDGLGAQIYGSPASVAVDTAAYAFAQAEESDRNAWLIATRLAGAPDENGAPAQLGGAELRQAWTALAETGFRGVYLDPAQNADAVNACRDLAAAITAGAATLAKQPQTLFFPMPLAGAGRLTRLSNGVWWLPSGRPARLLRYGDAILGYEIDLPLGDELPVERGTVLWSTVGKQDYTFFWDRFAEVKYYDSAGKPVKMKTSKKGELNLVLGSEPIVVVGMDGNEVFPLALATAQITEFERLIVQAEGQRMDTASMRTILKQAQDNLVPANAAVMYNSVGQYVTLLREALRPYFWLEGERAASHNFSGVSYLAGSSGGTVLRLDRREAPPSGVYKARFTLEVRKPASYEVWVAGKAPGRPGVSPLIWQVDEEPAVSVNSVTPVGNDYARDMTWYQLGRATLQAGKHQLLLVVPDKAAGPGGRYTAAIDAVVLSRDPFKPNGVEKPVNKIIPLPKEEGDKKKGKKRDKKNDEKKPPEKKTLEGDKTG